MIQRTLVLIKPDGVQRGIVGHIITRFENAEGVKSVAVGDNVGVDYILNDKGQALAKSIALEKAESMPKAAPEAAMQPAAPEAPKPEMQEKAPEAAAPEAQNPAPQANPTETPVQK